MMGTQNGPISGKIVKVVHDDSHEQVDDLKKKSQICNLDKVRKKLNVDYCSLF